MHPQQLQKQNLIRMCSNYFAAQKHTQTSETYRNGSQKFNSELQLQQRQVSDCNDNLWSLYLLFSSLLGIKLSS